MEESHLYSSLEAETGKELNHLQCEGGFFMPEIGETEMLEWYIRLKMTGLVVYAILAAVWLMHCCKDR